MKCPNCQATVIVVNGKLVQEISDIDVQMFNVESSFIQAVGYEQVSRTLKIKMVSGTYLYANVPMWVFTGIMDAPSKGEFYGENIKNAFRGWKL